MLADEGGSTGRERTRRTRQRTGDAVAASEHGGASSTHRPTPAELQEALDVIQTMKDRDPPLLARNARANPNVVACAIALQRGEQFDDDRQALRLFGAHPETKVRELWVDDKLANFAPAGMATEGPALPSFLLERGERSTVQSSDVPSHVGPEALEALHTASLRMVPPSLEGADREEAERNELGALEQDLAVMARSEREYVAWAAAHGAQRDEQHAALAASEPRYYWALAHRPGSPAEAKWQLRRGEALEADATCTLGPNLGVDEPLLLYRAFQPFTGEEHEATNHFAVRGGQREWLRTERAKLEAQVALEGTVPPLLPRVRDLDFGMEPPSDDHSEMGGSSVVGCSGFAAFADEERREHERRMAAHEERLAADLSNGYELRSERAIEDDGRRSIYYGRPAGELPSTAVAPPYGDWEPPDPFERDRRVRLDRLEKLLADRAYAATIPPPRRADAKYTPLKGNPVGTAAFRADRAVWYERITGTDLNGLSLSDQQELCDAVARRFRQYNDGRPERTAMEAIAEELEDRIDEQREEVERGRRV